MKRKETYLSRDFRETVALRFPAQAKELNTAFDMRLSALLAENADASKEKQYHLKRQILPGISAYETLQRVMPKEEALQIVHGYVERLARTSHKQLAACSDGRLGLFFSHRIPMASNLAIRSSVRTAQLFSGL